ncbi:MAG: hypothetical protein K0S76_991 [Herbinix sp.]|jgi:hypothetical protein|nr:hypothetical protein [Herbinix sp.]
MPDEKVLKKLSYQMNQKTKRIKGMKEEVTDFKYNDKHLDASIIAMFIMVYLIIYHIDTYVKFIYSLIFTPLTPITLGFKYILFPIVFTASLLCSLFYTNQEKKKKEVKDIYDNCRKDIITSMDNEYHHFCKHHKTCKCKENYIKYMDENDIDLIVK